MQQSMTEKEQDAEQQDAQAQHKQRPMLKHHADFAEIALAIPPRDENLYANGKAHRQSGEDKVIQARHHGSTQLNGAEVTQESGVGESDDGLRKVAQHDGVSDAPDFFVCNGGSNHVTKVAFLPDTKIIFPVFKQFLIHNLQNYVFLLLSKRNIKNEKT
jgi:hypothetical protein